LFLLTTGYIYFVCGEIFGGFRNSIFGRFGEVWPPMAYVRARQGDRNAGSQCGPNDMCESARRWEGIEKTRGRLRRIDLVIIVDVELA
jgi:hypothetical protein